MSQPKDTEGRMPLKRVIEEAGENDITDTDGHIAKAGRVEEAGESDTVNTTDTDGHGFRGGVEPADEGEDSEGEDSEGHGWTPLRKRR